MRELLPLLPANARRFLILFAVLSAALALLDSAALGVFALVLNQILQTTGGGEMTLPVLGTFSQQVGVFVLVGSALVMILKSFLNIWLQWISTRKFADYELEIGTVLFQSYIRAPWTERMKRSSSELVRMIDVGIANTVSGVLFPAVALPAQALTFVSVLIVLIGASWQTALVTVIYLGIIAAFLYLWLTKKSYVAGRVNRDASSKMAKLVTEMLGALKEITLRDKADEVGDVVMIVGGMTGALSSVAIFGLAGFKMVPALTSMQSSLTTVQSTLAYTETVIGDIRDAKTYRENAEMLGRQPIVGKPKMLELRGVEFTYPGAAHPAIQGINLTLPLGSSLGVVGQSGAGKSTLIDVFLGLLTPSAGTMTLDGVPLENVLFDWRYRKMCRFLTELWPKMSPCRGGTRWTS